MKTKRVCVLDHVEFVSVALVATKLRHSVQQRLVSRWTNEKVKEIHTKKKKTNTPARTRNTHPHPYRSKHTHRVCAALRWQLLMKMTIRAKASVRGRRTSTEVLSNQHASQPVSQPATTTTTATSTRRRRAHAELRAAAEFG